MRIVLAADIGGTLTKIGLVDEEGQILDSRVFDTLSNTPFEHFLSKLKEEFSLLKKPKKAVIKNKLVNRCFFIL